MVVSVDETPVILFTFGGRQPNIELQLPLAKRILRDYPNVEYHIWNFARNDEDRAYLKTIKGERITVFNGTGEGLRTTVGGMVLQDGFDSPVPTAVEGAKQFGAGEHNAAYKHYSQPQYKDTLFVKVDDDIVFLETARFGKFIEAIKENPGSTMVANIINNGACTPLTPGIWDGYQRMKIPLLDIHMSRHYCEFVHTYFFDHAEEILNAPIELVPTEDWTSINAVGYDWRMLRRVIKTIGTPQPEYLAGRPMHGWGKVFGDEGVFQTMPRIIVKGFTAAHLTFGPQNPYDHQLAAWREQYRQLGERYLTNAKPDTASGLPELSETSCGFVGVRTRQAQNAADTWGPGNWRSRALENDPLVGRYQP